MNEIYKLSSMLIKILDLLYIVNYNDITFLLFKYVSFHGDFMVLPLIKKNSIFYGDGFILEFLEI